LQGELPSCLVSDHSLGGEILCWRLLVGMQLYFLTGSDEPGKIKNQPDATVT